MESGPIAYILAEDLGPNGIHPLTQFQINLLIFWSPLLMCGWKSTLSTVGIKCPFSPPLIGKCSKHLDSFSVPRSTYVQLTDSVSGSMCAPISTHLSFNLLTHSVPEHTHSALG